MSDLALRVDGISKRFGPVLAVDRVRLELAPSELVALVGPSGCGKSTLLRLIAGLVEAEGGSIELAGAVVDDGRRSQPPERRNVGLVFQEHALFPHLQVGGNVAFGLRGPGDHDRRVREVLELVGLAGHADRYPHELSGGERQRVALARALAPSPSLMLLDEPFASLDPNLRSQIRRDVVRILREADTPAVFVTHDQAEALAVADRIAVMRSGQVVQVGTPEDVFHRPNSRFVASLMGEAAFLPVVDVDGELVTPIGSRCDRDELRGRRPDEVVAMVRPDDVSVRPADGGDAEIVGAEFRGSTWAYTLRLASGDLAQALASHLEGHLAVGTRVTACPVPGHTPTLLDGA